MLHLNVEMRVHNVIKVLEACVVELQRNKDKIVKPGPKDDPETILDDYEVNVLTSLYLLTIITRLLKNKNTVISGEELMHLYRMVYKLNKMNLTARDGQSLLHLAVNGISPVDDFHTSDICKFPCIDTVRILLHCGATVNCFDCDRSTPLHVLASTVRLSW